MTCDGRAYQALKKLQKDLEKQAGFEDLLEPVTASAVWQRWDAGMAPWPNQPCPHPGCARHITDLLAEMVPNEDQVKPEFKAIVRQMPGGSITCPYCQRPVGYAADGQALEISQGRPLRYSRAKMEARARDYGTQKSPANPDMTPEEWVAEDKLMPGALQGYVYAEDLRP